MGGGGQGVQLQHQQGIMKSDEIGLGSILAHGTRFFYVNCHFGRRILFHLSHLKILVLYYVAIEWVRITKPLPFLQYNHKMFK